MQHGRFSLQLGETPCEINLDAWTHAPQQTASYSITSSARTSVRGTAKHLGTSYSITRPGCRYRGLMRADAGWPGTLKRFPVSVIVVPLTRRIEKSRSR